MTGFGRDRPLHTHRLLVEFDLVAVGDLPADQLAGLLVRLASAGLMGLVTEIRRVELDGRTYTAPPDVASDVIRQLRPPPDPRIGQAVNAVEGALRALNAVLGRYPNPDEEHGDAVG